MTAPTNGGMPYRSWDRAGRDLLMAVMLMLLGWVGTTLTSLTESSARQGEAVRGIQSQLSLYRTESVTALVRHEDKDGHDGAIAKFGRIAGRVGALERAVYARRD